MTLAGIISAYTSRASKDTDDSSATQVGSHDGTVVANNIKQSAKRHIADHKGTDHAAGNQPSSMAPKTAAKITR